MMASLVPEKELCRRRDCLLLFLVSALDHGYFLVLLVLVLVLVLEDDDQYWVDLETVTYFSSTIQLPRSFLLASDQHMLEGEKKRESNEEAWKRESRYVTRPQMNSPLAYTIMKMKTP